MDPFPIVLLMASQYFKSSLTEMRNVFIESYCIFGEVLSFLRDPDILTQEKSCCKMGLLPLVALASFSHLCTTYKLIGELIKGDFKKGCPLWSTFFLWVLLSRNQILQKRNGSRLK